MNYAKEIENITNRILRKYEAKVGASSLIDDMSDAHEITGDVYSSEWKGEVLEVVFSDHEMDAFIAGAVSEKVYNEWQSAIRDLGLETYDSSGNILYLNRIIRFKNLFNDRYEVEETDNATLEIYDRVTHQGWSFEGACEDEDFPGSEALLDRIWATYEIHLGDIYSRLKSSQA